jgi:non-ribosomal peptide synthase protein (TIGR01720 family)/FkbM family methyltransferase
LNAEVFNCGLSRHNVMTTVTSYPLMSSMSGFYANRHEDEQVTRAFLANQDARLHSYADELIDGRFRSETFACELRTISDVISEHNVEKIDLLKVDAEKSELDILQGIRKDDWKKIRQIVIEVHDIEGRLHEITAILDQQGFHYVVEQDSSQTNTGLYNIYAVHPARARIATIETRAQLPSSSILPGITHSDLRAFLEERLPEYMVPSAFVKLDAIPLLPNGKINRKALSAPDWSRTETDEPREAPRTSIERRLAEIWKQTLGIEQVSIHDNFFALGGDSILGIQLITKANQAGFRLSIKELFQHKTIAALSEVAGSKGFALEVEEDVLSGTVRLTPAQLWFFEQQLADQHHFNQSVLVEVQPAEPRVFEQIFARLLEHHDALRLRFVYEDGEWRQTYGPSGEPAPFEWEDLSAYSDEEQQTRIESRTMALQSSLNLQNGPLMRAVVFNLGSGRPNVLLMVIHHLVVDGVSWRILTEDFETAYRQLLDGRPIQLPAKTASFKRWSDRLAEYAHSSEIQNEREYWLSRYEAPALPVDFAQGDNTVASIKTVSVSLSLPETTALLQNVPQAYNTQINDVLLTALMLAFSNWTGLHTLLVDLEGHGRETIDDTLDISRTVGWFTSVFPVILETPDSKEFGATLKSIKEQLRGAPNRGIGYGLLRYLNTDAEVAPRLSSQAQAEVSFNYLGKFETSETNSSIIGARRETAAPTRSPRNQRRYLLEINGGVNEGQLRLSWAYSTNRHQRASIEQLANDFIETLRSLIDHCVNLNERSYTPSDFPDADLNQSELDDLMAELSGSI